MASSIGNSDSNGGMSNPRCGDKYTIPRSETLSIYCNPNMYGRFVSISLQKHLGTAVTLCEVEVYSDGNGKIS